MLDIIPSRRILPRSCARSQVRASLTLCEGARKGCTLSSAGADRGCRRKEARPVQKSGLTATLTFGKRGRRETKTRKRQSGTLSMRRSRRGTRKGPSMPPHKNFALLTALALIALASPAGASARNYGCKGAVPVCNNAEALFFTRALLALLPKAWLKGPLRDFALRDPVVDVVVLAKATNEHSWLAPTMAF